MSSRPPPAPSSGDRLPPRTRALRTAAIVLLVLAVAVAIAALRGAFGIGGGSRAGAIVDTMQGGTFANAISGSGGLTKQGFGALTLSGQNTYTGLTTVRDGTLMLTGAVAGDVAVHGGTFASHGGKIGGNYVASSNGTTAVQVGTGMTVAGTASLDGTLQLLAPASTYTISGTEMSDPVRIARRRTKCSRLRAILCSSLLNSSITTGAPVRSATATGCELNRPTGATCGITSRARAIAGS